MAKTGGGRGAAGGGTIRKKTVKRGDNSYTYWEARITTGYDPATGKQIQRSFTGKTQKEVREKMQAAAVELSTGTYQEPSKLTLGEWLSTWENEYLNSVKPMTKLNYSQHIRNHILPALGRLKLANIRSPDIQKFYNQLAKEGAKVAKHDEHGNIVKKDGKPVYETAPLSAKTIKNIHGVLHKALEQAVKVGYLRTNPADACDLPKVERQEIKPLDEEDSAKLLQAIRGHRYERLYQVMLFTGMRRGEACGLQWDCVDLNKGSITIKQQLQNIPGQPKAYRLVPTKNSKGRTLSVAPYVVTLLKLEFERQAALKKSIGELWHDDGFVFCNDVGEHLSPHTVYHNFKRAVASIGLPDARLHDLRHSFAVASLQAGDDIKTVQGNLGHHTASFTLDVYGHVTEQMKQASAQRMEAYIEELTDPKGKNKGK